MQYMMQNRVTHTQATTFQTPYIDISDVAMITLNVILYSFTGTGPSVTVTLETSDDLEVWVAVGTPVANAALGSVLGTVDAKTSPYGRYARLSIVIGGTTPTVTYSVALNTFPSS